MVDNWIRCFIYRVDKTLIAGSIFESSRNVTNVRWWAGKPGIKVESK